MGLTLSLGFFAHGLDDDNYGMKCIDVDNQIEIIEGVVNSVCIAVVVQLVMIEMMVVHQFL